MAFPGGSTFKQALARSSLILFVGGMLLFLCEESWAQPVNCASAIGNATVVIPDTVAVTGGGFFHPDSVAVFTSEGTCVGKAPWPDSTVVTIALAGNGPLEEGGLRNEDPFHFRLYDVQRGQHRRASGTFVSCDRFPMGLQPLCRDDGLYKNDAIYKLEAVRLGPPSSDSLDVDELLLSAPYPNPTRGLTKIPFATPERQNVRLRLYDTLGRVVRRIGEGRVEGRQLMNADLSNLASGVYFLRLKSEGETRTRRITVVR